MGFVGLSMIRGLRHSRPDSEARAVLVGLLAAFVATILGNLLYHSYLNDFVWFLMGCGVALSRAVMREARQAESRTDSVAATVHSDAGLGREITPA